MNMRPVIIWLLAGCFLTAAMVVVGGITRLTRSGLSIVEWKPISGTLPPLNEEQWQAEFELYQTSPEFKIRNSHFTLEDFKGIFWWEYIHRLIGRLIGVVFLVPFIVFLLQKKIRGKLLWQCLGLFALGGLQGLIGWIMVASGLVDKPAVSHYRLALHLITAFSVFAFTLWVALGLMEKKPIAESEHKVRLRKWLWFFFPLLLVQILYGAFVAGLKAGTVANTWPTMHGEMAPSAMADGFAYYGFAAFFEDPITVHFIHRTFAYLVFLVPLFFLVRASMLKMDRNLKVVLHTLVAGVLLQFTLGVITVLLTVPVSMGAIHQLGALVLWTITWWGLHRTRKA
jgi:cytochrome c oxidase assembly protein subunit 15